LDFGPWTVPSNCSIYSNPTSLPSPEPHLPQALPTNIQK
jgi:hypothetical protein